MLSCVGVGKDAVYVKSGEDHGGDATADTRGDKNDFVPAVLETCCWVGVSEIDGTDGAGVVVTVSDDDAKDCQS